MPFLIEKLAGRQALRSEVAGDVLRIGRGTNADLRFDDPAVALEHAVIDRHEGGYRLLDRGSVTGTYLNGKPVGEARLASGDTIGIGGFQIQVQVTRPSDPLLLTVRPVAQPQAQGAAAVPLSVPVTDYVGAYGLRRRFLSKPLLAAGLALLTAAVVLALPRLGRAVFFQPGGVRRAHASLSCVSCHAPWRGPAARRCEDCHRVQTPLLGLVHQARQTFTPPCGGCHPEHRGESRAGEVDDQACVDCHGNLQVRETPPQEANAAAAGTAQAGQAGGAELVGAAVTAGAGPRFARSIRAFAADHADFSVTLPGGARLPLRDAIARRADPTPLRFNHQRHLRAALPTPSGRRVQLACKDCHRVEQEGGQTAIVPVSYERSCATSGCHPLTFDDRRPDRVAPHGQPRRVREFLLSVYADRRSRDESVRDLYRRLIRNPQAPPREIDFGAQAQRAVVQAERYLYGTACKECHFLDAGARPLPTVTWAPIPARWLPYARFSHLDHVDAQAGNCLDCHGGAAASTAASDVLLPSITACQGCHGGDGAGAAPSGAASIRTISTTPSSTGTAPGAPAATQPAPAPLSPRPAPTDCSTCHAYHPSLAPRPQAARLAPTEG
ncbi:MAG TPA: FHA domain-containing protein [Thermoanaerobaculia bacterium]|nr:FHA domain-containing protein [Thermoanaerobaculia bacterium]